MHWQVWRLQAPRKIRSSKGQTTFLVNQSELGISGLINKASYPWDHRFVLLGGCVCWLVLFWSVSKSIGWVTSLHSSQDWAQRFYPPSAKPPAEGQWFGVQLRAHALASQEWVLRLSTFPLCVPARPSGPLRRGAPHLTDSKQIKGIQLWELALHTELKT